MRYLLSDYPEMVIEFSAALNTDCAIVDTELKNDADYDDIFCIFAPHYLHLHPLPDMNEDEQKVLSTYGIPCSSKPTNLNPGQQWTTDMKFILLNKWKMRQDDSGGALVSQCEVLESTMPYSIINQEVIGGPGYPWLHPELAKVLVRHPRETWSVSVRGHLKLPDGKKYPQHKGKEQLAWVVVTEMSLTVTTLVEMHEARGTKEKLLEI